VGMFEVLVKSSGEHMQVKLWGAELASIFKRVAELASTHSYIIISINSYISL
jgi:hypothetical protein